MGTWKTPTNTLHKSAFIETRDDGKCWSGGPVNAVSSNRQFVQLLYVNAVLLDKPHFFQISPMGL